MASSYFKLRSLRRQRIACKKIIEAQLENKEFVNIQTNSERICRICLREANMPIYNNEKNPELENQIKTFGEIELDEKDMLPKYICDACYSRLQNAILFRKTAKKTDTLLHENYKQDHINNESIISSEEFDTQNKVHSCKLCELTFESVDEYSAHMASNKHKNVRIQCPICHGLFTAQLYGRHLARHQTASHMVCEVCGKMYRKDNLIRHLKLHTYELPYHCKMCPYRGRSVDSLKIHMRTHTGSKPYSCDKCQLRFLTRCNLSRHIMTHQKERPYKCAECGRGFYMKRDMESHIRSDHTGIKEFGCLLCGNKYGTKKALMRHELRVHKREKMARGRMPLYLQAEYRMEDEKT